MEKYFVGIDLGTGSTKAVAIDSAGNTLCTSQKYYPTNTPQPGFSEQNPCLIWEAFVFCLNDIALKLGQMPATVSFSAAMHSIMAVDKEGSPLSDAILWADSRSGEIAQSIRNSTQGEHIYRHTGTAIYAMSPLCKLIWLRANNYKLYSSAHKFISIKEYVWFKLFGVFEIDYSIASSTGLFDILELNWYDVSLKLAGVNASQLSMPVDTGHQRFLSDVNTALPGFGSQTCFVIGASDGCCANLGGNAVRPGIAALTIGTSGAVRIGSEAPVYNYRAMTFNYLLNAKTFICGGAVNNGGAAVDWLLKSFLNVGVITDEAYKELFNDIDTIKPGSEGLIFLPYLYAERAPIWDAQSSGAFLNINFKHRQQHFLRAVLEGICFALNDVLNAVEGSSEEVSEIVISGGFISSAVWVQLLADITGKKLVLQQEQDASAIGAIYIAMQAIGVAIEPILAREEQEKTIIEPNLQAHEVYKPIFKLYQQLYLNLKESMHLMHELSA